MLSAIVLGVACAATHSSKAQILDVNVGSDGQVEDQVHGVRNLDHGEGAYKSARNHKDDAGLWATLFGNGKASFVEGSADGRLEIKDAPDPSPDTPESDEPEDATTVRNKDAPDEPDVPVRKNPHPDADAPGPENATAPETSSTRKEQDETDTANFEVGSFGEIEGASLPGRRRAYWDSPEYWATHAPPLGVAGMLEKEATPLGKALAGIGQRGFWDEHFDEDEDQGALLETGYEDELGDGHWLSYDLPDLHKETFKESPLGRAMNGGLGAKRQYDDAAEELGPPDASLLEDEPLPASLPLKGDRRRATWPDWLNPIEPDPSMVK